MDKRLGSVTSHFGKKSRCVVLETDREYIVKPKNPRKLKHRDREVILRGISDSSGNAIVRFKDSNTHGKVDPGDLVPLGDLYEEEFIEE